MHKLPEEWIEAELDSIISERMTGLVRSAKEQDNEREFCYLKMNNLTTSGSFLLENLARVDATEDEVEKFRLKDGDFLFNTRNSVELVGKCGVFTQHFEEPILFNNNLLKLNFHLIKPDIVQHWFNSPIGRSNLNGIISATTSVAAIYQKTLVKQLIPLPPLAEQEVIAAKLDSLLSQVEQIKGRIDAVPAILKKFRQSVLAAAVSGKLTEAWRGSEELVGWEEIPFGKIIKNGPQNGLYKPSKLYGDGTKIIRIDGFYDGELCAWDTIKRVIIEDAELEKWKLNVNDILVNRVNSIEYLGKCGLVRVLPEDAVFESNIMRLSIDFEIDSPEYITIFLKSTIGIQRLRANAKLAVNQASINQNDVKSCLINRPPLEEQKEIVRQVEKLFAFADTIEARVTAAQSRVDNLTQSILTKAFRGDLTADWRTQNRDLITGVNSAAALLERIKEEREKLGVKKKRAVRKKKV